MTVVLPGLRADDPLGFLAAVGLVSLSEQGELPPLRLGWEPGGAPSAVVDGVADLDVLAQHLRITLDRLEQESGVIPGVPTDFPPRKEGSGGGDPMRMARERLRESTYERSHRDWRAGDPWFGRWTIALAASVTTKDSRRGDVELTPFYAPTGQMSLRVSIFEKTMEAVRSVDGPSDALTAWRRTGYDGANFDDRAKRDAGVTTSGKADNQGAPSPTWLAAMGMRFFAMTDNGRHVRTVGWQRVRMYEGFTYRSLVWPAWTPLLGPAALRTLLAHPALQLTVDDDEPRLPSRRRDQLRGLGVTAVFGASRRTGRRGDGPLGPARSVWRDEGRVRRGVS